MLEGLDNFMTKYILIPLTTMDIYPIILNIVGVKMENQTKFDGMDLLNIIKSTVKTHSLYDFGTTIQNDSPHTAIKLLYGLWKFSRLMNQLSFLSRTAFKKYERISTIRKGEILRPCCLAKIALETK